MMDTRTKGDTQMSEYTEEQAREIVADRAYDRLTEDADYYRERVATEGVHAVVGSFASELGDYLHYICNQDLPDAAYEGVAERALVEHGIIPPQ
jgi:hypothetical protein